MKPSIQQFFLNPVTLIFLSVFLSLENADSAEPVKALDEKLLKPSDFAGIPTILSLKKGSWMAELSPNGNQIVYVSQDYRAITNPALTERDLSQSAESDCRGSDLWLVNTPSIDGPHSRGVVWGIWTPTRQWRARRGSILRT